MQLCGGSSIDGGGRFAMATQIPDPMSTIIDRKENVNVCRYLREEDSGP